MFCGVLERNWLCVPVYNVDGGTLQSIQVGYVKNKSIYFERLFPNILKYTVDLEVKVKSLPGCSFNQFDMPITIESFEITFPKTV